MSAGRVEFFLSCSDLTAHHAFVGVFLKDVGTGKWIELGRTEVSFNSNPKYAKQFIVDFIFEEEQQLRFDVYRSSGNGNTAFISKNVIGSAAFKLSECVHAKRVLYINIYRFIMVHNTPQIRINITIISLPKHKKKQNNL